MKPHDQSRPMHAAIFILMCFAFFSLNIGLSMANAWALRIYGFSFPLILTICHMLFGFLFLLPIMLRPPHLAKHKEALRKQWAAVLILGTAMATNIACNNMSMVHISLSLNQIIRSAIPVFTCALSVFIEKRVPTMPEACSLVLLTAGVMVAMWQGSITGSIFGIWLCVISTVCNATMMCVMGKLLSEEIDVLRLNFYMSPVSALVLMPSFGIMEGARLAEYTHNTETWGFAWIVFVTSVMALSYNLLHSTIIHKITATAATVLGEMKVVVVLMLSAAFLGEHKEFTTTMCVGMLMALAGFCAYSHCKLEQRKMATYKQISTDEELIERMNTVSDGDMKGRPVLNLDSAARSRLGRFPSNMPSASFLPVYAKVPQSED